jgi:hypothetical protein
LEEEVVLTAPHTILQSLNRLAVPLLTFTFRFAIVLFSGNTGETEMGRLTTFKIVTVLYLDFFFFQVSCLDLNK